MVSSVSDMLDHLVLRNHLKIFGHTIDLRSDGIRFEKLSIADLVGKQFSFSSSGIDPEKIRVCVDGADVNFELRKENAKVFSILF